MQDGEAGGEHCKGGEEGHGGEGEEGGGQEKKQKTVMQEVLIIGILEERCGF